MPNCLIRIGGKDYIPVRAIPLVTSGQFTAATTVKMLARTDPWVSARSFVFDNGTIKEIDENEWRSFPPSSNYDELPAKAIVSCEALNEVWTTIYPPPEPGAVDGYGRPLPYPMPGTGQLLVDAVYEKVMEGVSVKSPQTQIAAVVPPKPKVRINSRNTRDAQIAAANQKFIQACLQEGIQFDQGSPPCRKEDLLTILQRIDPSIVMAPSTFRRYAKKLGLTWDKGRISSENLNVWKSIVQAVSRRLKI